MSAEVIRIATRKSPLALWQANWVRDRLMASDPDLEIELVGLTTRGDKILDAPLAKVGGKGLFIKELEQAMMENRADLAVHSMKDVPMDMPEGFSLGAICPREDPRDAMVSPEFATLADLPLNATVGTSSLRRRSQLLCLRPDLNIQSLRGNVNTRLQKLEDGQYDAIILAAAGLLRLGFADRIRCYIEPDEILPAAGQGAVGIEIREDDSRLRERLAPLHDHDTATCVNGERIINRRLGGGCQVPLASHAKLEGGKVSVSALVAMPDGSRSIYASGVDAPEHAAELCERLASELLEQGAAKILETLQDVW